MPVKKNRGVGLDIGSRKIKLVSLRKERGRLQIETWSSIPTPPGTAEAGIIHDPRRLGEALGEIVRESGLKDKNVISAVAGSQVYTRNLVMPRMKKDELKEAVRYQATTFLPLPVEETAMDVFPLHDFEDEEGKKTEVFLVAVRRQQVQNLELVCSLAGLQLKIVDIEPLALNRVLNDNSGNAVKAFLNLGASHSCFSVFQDEVPVFNRHWTLGMAAFYPQRETEIPDRDAAIAPGDEDYLVRDLIAEVARSVDYYNLQNPAALEKIILCGGGSRLRGWDKLIAVNVDCEVEIADPLVNFMLPSGVTEQVCRELRHDFAVALGLAVRGIG